MRSGSLGPCQVLFRIISVACTLGLSPVFDSTETLRPHATQGEDDAVTALVKVSRLLLWVALGSERGVQVRNQQAVVADHSPDISPWILVT